MVEQPEDQARARLEESVRRVSGRHISRYTPREQELLRAMHNEPNRKLWIDRFGRVRLVKPAADGNKGGGERISMAVATSLMGDPDCRPALVGAVMRHDVDEQLLGVVFEQLTVDDLRGIEISVAVRHTFEPKLRMLFTHPDADVRLPEPPWR